MIGRSRRMSDAVLGRVFSVRLGNPNHYLALTRLGEYRRPFGDFVWRYVMSRGKLSPRLPDEHENGWATRRDIRGPPFDMFTISEIYSWRCYPIRGDEKTVVDFGANIGISMGYFLGNLPQSPRVTDFEAAGKQLSPSAVRNLRAVRGTLRPYAGRGVGSRTGR